MNVEIGPEAALFPEKEYIKGIFVAVWEVDIIAACASLMANADANDSDRRRVFFNYTVSQLLPDRVVWSLGLLNMVLYIHMSWALN
jgi:hypothetical protein